MFRCDNCGSGYSTQAASSWTSCPRCLAKDKVLVPLSFELGWRRQQRHYETSERAPASESADRASALS